MVRAYKALKVRSQLGMWEEWESLHPLPEYYTYPCCLDPHPYIGLDKFIAGRLHQMRADKSYVATHPSWWTEDHDTTCLRYRSDYKTFKHAILHCPGRSDHRRRYQEPTLPSLQADSVTNLTKQG